jgi:hypothetical protein
MVSHDEYKEFVKDSFAKNVSTFMAANKPFTIEAFPDEFFELWANSSRAYDIFRRCIKLGGEIASCFIDGSHKYEFAKRDFANTDKYLSQGGFILFDDSADGSDWEVNRLAIEIENDSRYELVARNPNYLFRKR